ncbi:hypothetical protein HYT55_05695 [Candidatus Woesearchaeota archaeon]|nr:hypothetical protein [Candidatus Woesearchaeota archaeon]
MVDSAYLDQFRNEEVVRRLAKIPPARIDELVKNYFLLCKELCPRAKNEEEMLIDIEFDLWDEQRDPKAAVSKNDVPDIFTEVQAVVDQMLGRVRGERCNLYVTQHLLQEIDGLYLRGVRAIKINERVLASPANFRGVVAHEYSHHCFATGLQSPYSGFQIFEEGYANGVARAAQLYFSERDQNPLFKKRAFARTLGQLIKARAAPQKIPEPRYTGPAAILDDRAAYIAQNRHCLGNMLFAHLEAERGPDIYRQILQREFTW